MDFKEDDLEDFVDRWSEGERAEKRAKAIEMQERRQKKLKSRAEIEVEEKLPEVKWGSFKDALGKALKK